jgi:hypothetical protein
MRFFTSRIQPLLATLHLLPPAVTEPQCQAVCYPRCGFSWLCYVFPPKSNSRTRRVAPQGLSHVYSLILYGVQHLIRHYHCPSCYCHNMMLVFAHLIISVFLINLLLLSSIVSSLFMELGSSSTATANCQHLMYFYTSTFHYLTTQFSTNRNMSESPHSEVVSS